MKYDSIIIGGGLAGLVAGIKLARQQKRVAIFSTGQSALHFSSGSFSLLAYDSEGKIIDNPLKAIDALPRAHPYKTLGLERVDALAREVPALFAEAGITLNGSCEANHYRMTPFGFCRPCWLTLDDFYTCEGVDGHKIKSCLIVNFKGFLDFYPGYLGEGLEKAGIKSASATVEIEQIERLRHSVAEMRSASIARILKGSVLEELAEKINGLATGYDAVFIPAVVGIDNESPLKDLRRMVKTQLYCIPATPMGVCGLRMQTSLRRLFERLGGNYFLGDNVVRANMDGETRLRSIETAALGADLLEADNFVLATGGVFGHGIIADPQHFYEPLLGVDVEAPTDRSQWFDTDFFARQPYMSFGVSIDSSFHPLRNGKAIENLYAAGSILGSHDALNEGSGAGVAILTAMHVADLILK